MHVVIVNESIPFPATTGSRIRTLNLMLRMARRHRITLLCRCDSDTQITRKGAEYLNAHGIETIFVNDPPARKSGAMLCVNLLMNLTADEPYAVASHNSPAVRKAIKDYAAAHAVDLWQFEWMAYADVLREVPAARTVLMAHNIESLIWERYSHVETNRFKRQYLRGQWRKFEQTEKRLFAQSTSVVAVSEQDAELARRRYGARNMTVVENGIDTDFFKQARGKRDPFQILFLGSLDWQPNQDAVRLLLDQIFPQVAAAVPFAQLAIVGRQPPAWLKRRASGLTNVELHADVGDVRPFLARSGVMAVPLRIGGGSRLKILEALACGLPVVSTTIGCEGLKLRPGYEIIVADQAEAFSASLIKCLREPHRALETARRGQATVLRRHDWNLLAVQLEKIWMQTVAGSPNCDLQGNLAPAPAVPAHAASLSSVTGKPRPVAV